MLLVTVRSVYCVRSNCCVSCVVQLAFESLSVIVNALMLLEVGQVSVYRYEPDASTQTESRSVDISLCLHVLTVTLTCLCSSFGEHVQLLHPFHQQFHDESGVRILRLCQFQQKKTRIAQVGGRQ